MTGCLMIATLILMHSAEIVHMRTHMTNTDLRLDSGRAKSHDRGTLWVAASIFTGWPPDLYWDIFRAVNPTPYSRWSIFIITRRNIFSSVGRHGYISVEAQVGLRRRGPRKHSKSDTKAWVGLKAVPGVYTYYNEHCWAQDTCKI